ncbi:MAG: hypothetical protein JXR86_10560 [Spirochaetales bacterium]|nr:hypothetical protein [Spirochaetales bacterium]
MGKVILITGSETLLGRKLIEKNLAAGNKVIAPVISRDENSGEPQKNNLLVLPWNKSSIISSRTVIREGMRIFRSIDDAILVYSENKTNDQLSDFSTSEIDEAIESSIHGTVYLTRELLKIMDGDPAKVLSFVLTRKNRQSGSPMEKGFLGFFRSFADAVITAEGNPYKCAFTSEVTDMDSFALFINSILSDKPAKGGGQWLDYREKKNLFSSLPVIPRKPDTI